MMFGARKDGKIRVRCPECGRKLKFPAGNPGVILRCPICMHNIIAPLDDAAPEPQEEAKPEPAPRAEPAAAEPQQAPAAEPQQAPTAEPQQAPATEPQQAPAATAPAYPRRRTGGKLVDKLDAWTPQAPRERRNDSIARLVTFLNRENERIRGRAVDTIHDPDIPAQQTQQRLLALRQEKNTRLRSEIDKIVRSLDEEILSLTHHPMAARASVRAQLEEKKAEKSGLFLFLKLIFGLRLADTHKQQVTPGA